MVALAKRYGIATPYTSYLVVPDGPMPVVPPPRPPSAVRVPATGSADRRRLRPSLAVADSAARLRASTRRPRAASRGRRDFAKQQAGEKGDGKSRLAANRGATTERQVKDALDKLKNEKDPALRAKLTERCKRLAEQKTDVGRANTAFKGKKGGYQTGQLGVDLSCAANNLRNQERVSLTANRQV